MLTLGTTFRFIKTFLDIFLYNTNHNVITIADLKLEINLFGCIICFVNFL